MHGITERLLLTLVYWMWCREKSLHVRADKLPHQGILMVWVETQGAVDRILTNVPAVKLHPMGDNLAPFTTALPGLIPKLLGYVKY